jgi:transposase
MRAFGIELSPNIRSIQGNRRELTKEERASIVTARMAGVLRKILATNFRCTEATITRTVKRFHTHQTVESLLRSGRPLKLTTVEVRYITTLIKRNPTICWAALYKGGASGVSRTTLRRALGPKFRRKWRSIKRIALDPEKAANRLAYGKALKGKDAIVLEVYCLA